MLLLTQCPEFQTPIVQVLVDYNSSDRFTQTKLNYVAWNDISLTNQDSDDTGEIEM
jgi:hypothetical protein